MRYPDEWVEALAKLHAEQDGEDWNDPSVYGGAEPDKFRADYRETAVAFLDLVEPFIRERTAERIATALEARRKFVPLTCRSALERAADIAREHGKSR